MKKLATTVFSLALMAMYAGLPAAAQQEGKAPSRPAQQRPAQQHPTSSDADNVFSTLDKNQDGKLNEAEFRAFAGKDKKASFAAWDADGDKSISKAEFDAKYSAEHSK